MSVYFINLDRTLRIGINGGIPGKCTVYGREFPTEDIKAYWSMVPYLVTVEWLAEAGVFLVTSDYLVENYDEYEYQPKKRLEVMASDAHKLSVWMSIISELCSE